MSNEMHNELLELKNRIFNLWLENPESEELNAQLEVIDNIIFNIRK